MTKRTNLQNRSIHSWFDEVARECQNYGITQRMTLEAMDIDHTPTSVKMYFQQIAKIKFGKNQKRDLTTGEITEVFEEYNKVLAKYDLHVPFHSQENTEEYLNSYNEN